MLDRGIDGKSGNDQPDGTGIMEQPYLWFLGHKLLDCNARSLPCRTGWNRLVVRLIAPLAFECRPITAGWLSSILTSCGHGRFPWPSSCASATLAASFSRRSGCAGGAADFVASIPTPAGANGRVSLANPWPRHKTVAISF
jgi:hypothetical protein